MLTRMGHRLATAGRSRDQAALARRLPSSLTLGRALRNIGPRRRVRRLVRRSLGGGGNFSEGGSYGEVGTHAPYNQPWVQPPRPQRARNFPWPARRLPVSANFYMSVTHLARSTGTFPHPYVYPDKIQCIQICSRHRRRQHLPGSAPRVQCPSVCCQQRMVFRRSPFQ